ncbi:MAG TPA: acyltransferase domain-containing protein, partial [Thermoanaerobaculia bacterium]
RRAFPRRCIAVGRGAGDAADIAAVLRGQTPERLFARAAPETAPPVVFLFPGQGSQRPGMGAGLYRAEPVFRREVDRGCELLLPALGFDLRDLLLAPADSEEAARRLAATEVTQPALFVVEHALARLWMEWGVRPQALIGHSIGEYVAACLAGVFSLEDALGLVASRGRLIATLPPGAMLAVSLPELDAAHWASEHGLAVAAVNAPGASVLSGPVEAVEDLAGRLAAEGIEHRRLRTSHAFHSAALEPILESFRAEVARRELHPPSLPWISNLSGSWVRPGEATDPGYWTRHLRETVRFAAGIEELLRVPGKVFLEVGPGRSLSSLVRAGLKQGGEGTVLSSLPGSREPESPQDDVRQVQEALGRLWLAGVEIDWPAMHAHETRRRVPLPTYPFERRRYWVDGVEPAGADRRLRRFAAGQSVDNVAGWFWAPLWRQAVPLDHREPWEAQGAWLVFAGEDGFGDRMTARLRERGCTVATVHAGESFQEQEGSFSLRPGEPADHDALFDRLAQQGIAPARIVHLWSTGMDRGVEAELERGLYSLFHLARALGDRRPEGHRPALHLRIVTTGAQRITGMDALVPVRATALGPAATLPQEYPGLTCAAIDITLLPADSREERELIDLLLAEVAELADSVVAYRGTDRWLRVFEPQPLGNLQGPQGTPPWREGGTWL